MFTFDEHFQRNHSEKQTAQQRHYDRWKRRGCGHVTLIFTRPLHDIVFGVISASTGLLTEPYRGAKRNGVVGFGKGVGVGILGLFVKPFVGVFDAFAHVMGSIDDMARSVNLLDVKFKPIERYRLPYTFGAGRMLLPFDQVRSKTAQLLLAHPLEKKKRCDEVIVTSQALRIGPGCEHYIAVTTRRIVFFKLRDMDSNGFITVSLEWQVRFENGFRVSSSLGTKGHNVTVLYISKAGSLPEGNAEEVSLSSLEDNDDFIQMQNKSEHDSSINLDRTYSVPETPRAFRLRNTRLFASTDTEGVQRFAIEGNFGQRRQLLHVHNAICCLSGDFNNLIHEIHITGSEGITTFGNLSFDIQGRASEYEDPKHLFSILECAPWKHVPETCVWPTDEFKQVVSTVMDSNSEVASFGSGGLSGTKNQFTFAEFSSEESHNSSVIQQMQITPEETPRVITQERTTGNELQSYNGNKESIDTHTLDSRLKRVEELLEQFVHSQPLSSEIPSHRSSQNLSPILEMENGPEEHFNPKEAPQVDALRNEISELKRHIAAQAEVNIQLQAQVEASKKSKSKVRVTKFFRKKAA
jgi:hypothetical protein